MLSRSANRKTAPRHKKTRAQRYAKLPKGWPCKPCWELKYCPYGPLVEFFPLLARGDETVKSWWPDNDFMGCVHPGHAELLKKCDPFEISCNVFGHVCPVFAMAEGLTETREERYSGRYIPRDVMLKVVRRDNYLCQISHRHVPDDEIEIGHIIPHAKGGPTKPDNLRLLCRPCNRAKPDSTRLTLSDFAPTPIQARRRIDWQGVIRSKSSSELDDRMVALSEECAPTPRSLR
jgi:hypothetical protein